MMTGILEQDDAAPGLWHIMRHKLTYAGANTELYAYKEMYLFTTCLFVCLFFIDGFWVQYLPNSQTVHSASYQTHTAAVTYTDSWIKQTSSDCMDFCTTWQFFTWHLYTGWLCGSLRVRVGSKGYMFLTCVVQSHLSHLQTLTGSQPAAFCLLFQIISHLCTICPYSAGICAMCSNWTKRMWVVQ